MPPAPLVPADVVRIMAEERLSAAGGPAVARFRIQIATLTREPSAGGGVFSAPTERLPASLRCRLEIRGEDGSPGRLRRGRGAPRPRCSPPAARPNAPARRRQIVRAAGNDLNVEFEYQLRRNLRALLAPAGPAAPEAPAAPAPPVPEEPASLDI